MDIDERLKFLVTSTESLNASCQELHAMMRDEREAREELDKKSNAERQNTLRIERAMLRAIRAALEGLTGEAE